MIWWERAEGHELFVAYRCFDSVITYKDKKKREITVPHVVRLPYSQAMLERRAAWNSDLPEWFKETTDGGIDESC